MDTSKKAKKVLEDNLELIIPTLVLDKLNYVKTSNKGDVSRSYNITLKSPANEELFVDSDENLRDLLQEYLNYRKCYKEVEENLNKQKSNHSKDASQSDNKIPSAKKKIKKRTTKITRVEYYRTPEDSACSISDISQLSRDRERPSSPKPKENKRSDKCQVSRDDEGPSSPKRKDNERPGSPIRRENKRSGSPIPTDDERPSSPIRRDKRSGSPIPRDNERPRSPIPMEYEQPGCSQDCKGMSETKKGSCCVIL